MALKNTSPTNESKVAYIEFEGEGVVTAADIQVDPDIQIMNPDLVIAHLNGGVDSKLYMELTITKGRGYVSSDKNKKEEMAIDVIPIDSIFTPIERVNINIENTRVGQITDFDKLTLDVYTNGTLDPDEAVSLAAKVMSEHLNTFIGCLIGEFLHRINSCSLQTVIRTNRQFQLINAEFKNLHRIVFLFLYDHFCHTSFF